jgi:Tat protein secretion system quality control protein TatD with DNase activity
MSYSHPAFVYSTVETLAKLKNISIEKILEHNRRNVRKVYSI